MRSATEVIESILLVDADDEDFMDSEDLSEIVLLDLEVDLVGGQASWASDIWHLQKRKDWETEPFNFPA